VRVKKKKVCGLNHDVHNLRPFALSEQNIVHLIDHNLVAHGE